MADQSGRACEAGTSDEGESEALVALYRQLGGDVAELSGPRDLVAAISGLALRPPGTRHSFVEAASRSGAPLDLARRAWAGLGLESDLDALSGDDVALLATIGATAELIGESGVIELSRVIGLSVSRLAEVLASLIRVGLEAPPDRIDQSRVDLARTYFELIGERVPALVAVVDTALRHHLVRIAGHAWRPDVSRTVATRDVAVGFADLVGFTEWTAAASLAELADALDAFEETVWEAADVSGIEIVKLIGDEVMFAAATVDQALDGARILLAASHSQPSIEAVRVGISLGEAVTRSGDIFGVVVNEASRLVAAAEPGTVLVSEAAVGAAKDGIGFAQPIPVTAKGFDEPIRARVLLV